MLKAQLGNGQGGHFQPKLFFNLTIHLPKRLLFQSVPHRLAQTSGPILVKVIGRSLAHGLNSDILVDGAGHEDERDVQLLFTQVLKRCEQLKSW